MKVEAATETPMHPWSGGMGDGGWGMGEGGGGRRGAS